MPSSIVQSFALKTGKSIEEIEKKWEEAKAIVKKKTSESDKRFYPTVVSVLKNMLGLNEDVAMTTTADIAVVPKRLGEKPMKQASLYDGDLNGFPYAPQEEQGVLAIFAILCSKKILPWQILDLMFQNWERKKAY